MRAALFLLSSLVVTSCFKGFDFREKAGARGNNASPVIVEQTVYEQLLNANLNVEEIAEIMALANFEDKAEALHTAVMHNNKNLLPLLMKYHVEIEGKYQGFTLLMNAVMYGDLDTVSSVIDYEIEAGLLNALCESTLTKSFVPGVVFTFEGWTALDFAISLVTASNDPGLAQYAKPGVDYSAIRDFLIAKGSNAGIPNQNN